MLTPGGDLAHAASVYEKNAFVQPDGPASHPESPRETGARLLPSRCVL